MKKRKKRTIKNYDCSFLKNVIWLVLVLLLIPAFALGQNKSFSGLVLNEIGEPVIGATVIVKGTSNGTVTDADGRFVIKVDPATETVLQISYLGYHTQEVSIIGKTNINIVLTEDTKALDEVVVVGFGSAKKRDLVGSLAQIKGDQITKLPAANLQESLQGMASGLWVKTTVANPGSPVTVKIRGINSINLSTDPLWIIDGIPVSSGSTGARTDGNVAPVSVISMINPNDIESIEVLKDASATAIYGSRASGGVILITTKSNKAKSTGISLSYEGGVSKLLINQWDYFADTKSWWAMTDKATANNRPPQAELTPAFIMSTQFQGDKPEMTRDQAMEINNDQLGIMTQSALFTQFGLTATKGFDKGGMMFSANYRNEEGILKNNDFERMTARYNINFDPINDLSIGLTTNLMYINSNGVTSPDPTKGIGGFGQLIWTLPWYKTYDTNSPSGYWAAASGYNPLSYSDPNLYLNNVKDYRTISNAYLSWRTPVKGLTVRGDVGIDFSMMKNSYWRSALLDPTGADQNQAYNLETQSAGTNWDAYATYDQTFGKHSINASVGFEGNHYWAYSSYMNAAQTQTAYPEIINPLQMKEMNSRQNGENMMVGLFARATYKFLDRYIVNASVRRDGLQAFSDDNRWANFYAFGAGWILSDEAFLKDVKPLNLLKLRASYGTTGNSNVSSSMTWTVWNLNASRIYGASTIPGATWVGPIGSDKLKWETTKNLDLGFDYGLLGNRINGSFAYYRQNISDLIMRSPLAPSVGYGAGGEANVWENVGDMKNWGFEFNVSTTNIATKEFMWKTDFNISTSKNKIIRLNKSEKGKGSISGNMIRREGEALNTYYLSNYINVDPEKGIYMIEERDQKKWDSESITVSTGKAIPMNNTNVVTNQMVQSGKTNLPTFYGGFGNTLMYKGFDLNIQFNYAGGNWLINDVDMSTSEFSGVGNLMKGLDAKSWQKPGDIANYPLMSYRGLYNYDNVGNPTADGVTTQFNDVRNSTRFLERGDYIRLKNLQLGYTFPSTIIPRKTLNSLRIYVGVTNLFTITSYGGFDPEMGNMCYLPSPRTVNFGLSISL